MEARAWFRIDPPEGAQLEALLDFAAARRARYPTFLLVQREPTATRKPSALLEALAEHQVTETITDRWPQDGAEAESAHLRFYKLEPHAARVLAKMGSLAAFAPPLPEDLAILTADKTPWLASSWRERAYRLHLTAEEQRELRKALPWLKLTPEAR